MNKAAKNIYDYKKIQIFCGKKISYRHNTSYWKGEKYLGIGPSAHSYNVDSRQWNVSSISGYIDSIEKGIIPSEKEVLTASQKFNEYVMTRLRTQWGIDSEVILKQFGEKYASHVLEKTKKYLEDKLIEKKENVFRLTREGKFFADRIASEIFSA